MDEDLFKIIGIIFFACFMLYLVVKGFQLQSSVIEGLTNASTESSTPTSSGEAGGAVNYSASIKAKVIKLQDELLISKYRKDYEDIILNMDDYVSILMLKQLINMKLNGDDTKANIDAINSLNILKSSKDSLNDTMKWLDKQ